MLVDREPELRAEAERAIREIEEHQGKEQFESESNDDSMDESNIQENDTNES
jgi:hypothetical protein